MCAMIIVKGGEILESLGNRIKLLRRQRGFTQSKLSELSKISTMSIRRYETGERTPDIEQIQRLAYALGVSTHELQYGALDTTGKKIQYYRGQQNLSLEELSSKTSIPIENLKAYEEDAAYPADDDFAKLCENLFIFPDELREIPGVKHTMTKDNVMITSAEAPDLNRNELLKHYDMLNKSGRGKAIEQVKMLAMIPEYTAPDKEENQS